jgi:AcrR family transcriptional regulator
VTQRRRERADAIRNRAAILDAAEELLRHDHPERVTIERVADAAGVGKATVFHRFGSRTGLMQAVMRQRAAALADAVAAGAPPLGPGAAAGERLVAFLDAVVDLATHNAGLLTAHEHAVATRKNTAESRQANPVYQSWHAHIATLIEQARPELDAALIAHMLLGCLHAGPIAQLIRDGESDRLASCLRLLVGTLLDAPAPVAYCADC